MKKKKKNGPVELQAKNAKPATKGPEAERLKIDRPWEQAIDRALKVRKPKKGWPK